MGNIVEDILYGALGRGVNKPTLALLNVLMAATVGTLLILLGLSVANNPPLVPHVCVLLVLAIALWVLINWFISNLGLADPEEQRREVFGEAAGSGSKQKQAEDAEEIQEGEEAAKSRKAQKGQQSEGKKAR